MQRALILQIDEIFHFFRCRLCSADFAQLSFFLPKINKMTNVIFLLFKLLRSFLWRRHRIGNLPTQDKRVEMQCRVCRLIHFLNLKVNEGSRQIFRLIFVGIKMFSVRSKTPRYCVQVSYNINSVA